MRWPWGRTPIGFKCYWRISGSGLELDTISPIAIAACMEGLIGKRSAPTVKQHLAANGDHGQTRHGCRRPPASRRVSVTSHSKYSGARSQTSKGDVQTSWTGTLFMGMRFLPGTEVYCNPEARVLVVV